MRTLFLRVRSASQSAQVVADYFNGHALVRELLYPGLPGAQGHAIALRQISGGYGGMLSIRAAGGELAAIATAARVALWKRAPSLGGTESLIGHGASVEGAGTPVAPDLLRLPVGIEDAGDLLADLERALQMAHR